MISRSSAPTLGPIRSGGKGGPRSVDRTLGSKHIWFIGWAIILLWFVVANVRLLGLAPNKSAAAAPVTEAAVMSDVIPRSKATSLVESPTWQWGACGGAVPMYPSSVCGRLYCVRSKAHPHMYIDLFYRAFSAINEQSVISLCEEPTGGQLGPRRGGTSEIEVSFIITYKDNPMRTVQCMLELFRTAREADSVEFVLVNDGSVNATASVDNAAHVLHSHFGVKVTRIHNQESVGYGTANNMGIKAASGKYIVLMNNDAFVTQGWLKSLLATIKEEQHPGIVGPLFVNSTGFVMEAGGAVWADGNAGNVGRGLQPKHYHLYKRRVDYVSAACIMMEREVFLSVGGFKPEYGMGYWEDTDLAMEVASRGMTVVYQPMSIVVHNEGGSLSEAKEQLMRRNQQLFINRWKHILQRDHCKPGIELQHAAMRMAGAYRLLWVDDIVPEPDRDSGSIRALNMVRIFQALGFLVDYQPTAPRDAKYTADAGFRGIHVLPVRTANEISVKYGSYCFYNVVLVARAYIYEKAVRHIQSNCPGVPIIFDTVDVAFLREARVQMTNGTERWSWPDNRNLTNWLLSPNTTAEQGIISVKMDKELGLMQTAAVTVVVSPAEQELLHQFIPGVRIHVISNVHDVHLTHQAPDGCERRRGILFVGNFNHLPNQQAIVALLDDVLPKVAALITPEEMEEFVVHVVGSNSRVETDLLRTEFNVKFHGWLSDIELRILYRSVKLVVAPLMSGAGVKGKINQAMLYGVPVVATPVAAEGMRLEDGVNTMLGSTPAQFAHKLMRVYRDCALWNSLVSAGYENIDTYFSMAAATRNVASMMVELGFTVPVPKNTFACNHVQPT